MSFHIFVLYECLGTAGGGKVHFIAILEAARMTSGSWSRLHMTDYESMFQFRCRSVVIGICMYMYYVYIYRIDNMCAPFPYRDAVFETGWGHIYSHAFDDLFILSTWYLSLKGPQFVVQLSCPPFLKSWLCRISWFRSFPARLQASLYVVYTIKRGLHKGSFEVLLHHRVLSIRLDRLIMTIFNGIPSRLWKHNIWFHYLLDYNIMS